MTSPFVSNRVVVRGAGEMATGVIHRLITAGCEVIALEIPKPTFVRQLVCFAEACYNSPVSVEGIRGILVRSVEDALAQAKSGDAAVLIDPDADTLSSFRAMAHVDARMLKGEDMPEFYTAPIVIGLGPGFNAGVNCHAVIETNRGNNLGRPIYSGPAQNDTGVPGEVQGFSVERVLRSPADGTFTAHCQITDMVKAGQIIGDVAGTPVTARLDGIVRGLIHNGLVVSRDMKIGDIDPRSIKDYCFKISDKARIIGAGALEALETLKDRTVQGIS